MTLDPIGDMLAPFLERLGFEKPDAAARVSREWGQFAGSPWAEETRPATLRGGELVVEVRTAASASVLRYRTGELLERLDALLGEGVVEVIRIRVAARPF